MATGSPTWFPWGQHRTSRLIECGIFDDRYCEAGIAFPRRQSATRPGELQRRQTIWLQHVCSCECPGHRHSVESVVIHRDADDQFPWRVDLKCDPGFDGAGLLGYIEPYLSGDFSSSGAIAPTCSLDPAQGQVSPQSPVKSTLQVSTTAASAAETSSMPYAEEVFAALLVLGLEPRRRRIGNNALIAILAVGVVLTLVGCGGGGGMTAPVVPATTLRGLIEVVVTATSGSVSTSTTISLTVQ